MNQAQIKVKQSVRSLGVLFKVAFVPIFDDACALGADSFRVALRIIKIPWTEFGHHADGDNQWESSSPPIGADFEGKKEQRVHEEQARECQQRQVQAEGAATAGDLAVSWS